MESIKLHSVALNKSVTYLSKTFGSTIRPGENNVVKIEYLQDIQTIKLVFETMPGAPTVVLIPFQNVAGIVPEPEQEHLEAGIAPRVAPPEPVYVPEPLPVPAPEPPTVTVEQADEIRRQYKLLHAAPKPQDWEVETAAYAEKKQRRHMGLSDALTPETKELLQKEYDDSVAEDLKYVGENTKHELSPESIEILETENARVQEPTKPKKAKRKNKRKGK